MGCLGLGACHLAETIDPVKCAAGNHMAQGQCVPDALDGPTIAIASCVLTPDSLKVAPNGEFRFQNNDAVDRTITGDDGKVWATAKARLDSPILSITKPGTWRYHVSDCPNGGAVVVE